jgi:F-type H+-transporting ATPase subunit b
MRAAAVPAALLLLPGAASAASGMPQLDFANPLTVTQAVWLLVIFGGLYLVLSRIALPPVAAVLERRAAVIRTDLDAAKGASEAAKAAQAERERAEAKARADAQAAIRGAVDAAKTQAGAAIGKVESRLAGELREAESRIAASRRSAMAGIGQVAAEAAAAAVQRVAGFVPDQGAVQAAVGAALAGRN